MEVKGQLQAPAALLPKYLLDWRLGSPTVGLDAVEKSIIMQYMESNTGRSPRRYIDSKSKCAVFKQCFG
jgi:hypothetical protein